MNPLVSLSKLSVTGLESLLSRYPWFALARRELYLRTSAMGEEYRKLGMKKAGVYVSSRERLVRSAGGSPSGGTAVRTPEGSPSRRGVSAPDIRDRQAIRIIGGDWFSQEDLESVSSMTFDIPEPEKAGHTPAAAVPAVPRLPEEAFCTETLARIYGEQELHQRAIEVYEKLILIYPEKSAYFAALIQEQKKHI